MDEAKIIELNDNNICKICENQLGKYTCPRCNIFYCTLTCYQSPKHIKCSENFYRDCVMEDLNSGDVDETSKTKMLEILQKFNDQSNDLEMEEMDSDDDDEQPELADRLANIDLNDVKTVWEQLTADERQEFESLVKSGDVTKLVPIWTPWWDFKVETKLVEEVGTSTTPPRDDYQKNCPAIVSNIKPFEQISKVKPAECVKYNLLNVISAYSCTVRYFNGDHFDFAQEAVYLLTSLSKNLESNANFESYSLAVESVHQQSLVNDWMSVDPEHKSRLHKDVKNITEGPEKNNRTFYIKCALSDMHRLFLQSKKTISTPKNDSDFSKKFADHDIPADKIISKDKLKIYVRKIEYYLSYINSFVCNFM